MDETEQQFQLEAIPKVTDGDPSLKESVDDDDDDDDVKHSTTKKSISEDSNSENLAEICKANGNKKETNECDTPTDVIETLGGEVQEEKRNFDDKLIEVHEDIKNQLEEICEGLEASEINNCSVISVNNSNLSKNSSHEDKNEEGYKNELGALLGELNDNVVDADQCNKPDLNENKESSGHIIVNIEETEININVEKKISDIFEEQNSVKQLESIFDDGKEAADQEESEPKADQEEGEPKADQEENEPKADQEEGEPKADQEEGEPKADQEEGEPKADQEEGEPKADQEENEPKADQEEGEPKADQLSLELDSHVEISDKDTSNVLEPDLCQVDEFNENSSETNQSVNQDKETADNKLNEDLMKFSPIKLADLQNNSPIELSTEVAIENKTAPNSEEEQDNEKAETFTVLTNQESDVCESNIQSESETTLPESEKESVGIHNKSDSIEDSIESQVNVSKNSEEQDEENKSKSENEGNELVDTEMVNCGDIDQEEVNENESLKEKEIDRIQIEPVESDSKNEARILDILEDTLSGEETDETQTIQTNEILGNEFINNEPGNSAEETVTGYSTNLKEKEDNCIIPDGGILKLADLQQITKETRKSKEESEILKPTKIAAAVEKPKTRAQDKKIEAVDASKPRPTRSAAKLAENKIRSLVANDLVFEEGTSPKDFEDQAGEEEDQENDEELTECAQCGQVKICKFITFQNIGSYYFCSDACITAFKIFHTDKELTDSEKMAMSCTRKCSQCNADIIIRNHRRLFWETMDFCDEDCLAPYQHKFGSYCANCKGVVGSSSIGKYCVRFGFDIKQFCSGVCLEEYKKGLKVCSYCQKDISTGVEGFLAPVGSKNKFKDFCSQSCMEKYELMSTTVPAPEIIEECAVCSNKKPVRVQVELDEKTHKLCSEPCFAAFKFVNNITEGQCEMCHKYYDCSKTPKHVVRINFYDEAFHAFCSRTCLNVYILANRTIVPCNWCKIKKYDFDMIKQINSIGQLIMMCSISCLMSYRMSIKPSYLPRMRCGFCIKNRKPLYYLTMTDSTTRYFCNSTCVMAFQNCYKKKGCDTSRGSSNTPKPVGGPKRMMHPKLAQKESTCIPIISSVQSLASNSPAIPAAKVPLPRPDAGAKTSQQHTISPPVVPVAIPPPPPPPPPPMPPSIRQQIIVKPPETKEMKNKSILCKPYSHTKGVSCRPHPCMKETQTDQSLNRKFLIPIPVPIYVPAPMHMFATPFPVPVPFPLPIPVPIFIPTTRNSAKGIMKEIKKIQEKIPTDPFEAELLMMAEMVAGDKKQDPTDSESEDGNEPEEKPDGTFYPENVDTSNTFGDDMLQMALKMASELEEPAVDMESVLTSSTITTNTQPPVDPNKALYATDDPDQVNVMGINRGRKRSVRGNRNSAGGTPSKRGRRTSGSVDVPLLPPPEPAPPRPIEVEKPDANMCLKYTFGVNAWRHWVMQKNAELEKAALTNRKIKLFKPDLLQLTADELNFSLCLFVKEVRKPNGTEYAPDTIYYLCLGIQQYLFENGRIDNIFTDSYYEKFTDCLDEVAKKFAALYNDSQYIVTRVEEEHLWESKQLGAHSPHVLLSTLMFFNTKHFNLVTVEEHMQLSFSHIMKHWKRNPNTPGVAKAPGSRNVLLRFYPPQSALEANSRKKKVYEQQENEENPLRCPVKLYEFYLSKCPESVKTRNDVFYLLPERSCVPDSPVWYSTMALGKEPLMKMLHRVKMVKEINIALLTS